MWRQKHKHKRKRKTDKLDFVKIKIVLYFKEHHQESENNPQDGRKYLQIISDCRQTYFDGPVPRGRHDVLIIEVHNIHSSTVADQDAAQGDVGGRGHVPHSDGAVLGTGDHQAIAEAQMQHSLVVVDQRVQNLACIHIPDSRGQKHSAN